MGGQCPPSFESGGAPAPLAPPISPPLHGVEGDLMACWASDCGSGKPTLGDSETFEALLAVDVVTLELLGISVDV